MRHYIGAGPGQAVCLKGRLISDRPIYCQVGILQLTCHPCVKMDVEIIAEFSPVVLNVGPLYLQNNSLLLVGVDVGMVIFFRPISSQK